jgi:hypothetical protein
MRSLKISFFYDVRFVFRSAPIKQQELVRLGLVNHPTDHPAGYPKCATIFDTFELPIAFRQSTIVHHLGLQHE